MAQTIRIEGLMIAVMLKFICIMAWSAEAVEP